MDWTKFLADEVTKVYAFDVLVLFSIVGTICVPGSICLPDLLMIDVFILPWVWMAVRMIIHCCCARYGGCFVSERWDKIDSAIEFYFTRICVEIVLVGLLILNVVYGVLNPSILWPSDLQVWQRAILVTYYVLEVGLYVFYIAHRIAFKKMEIRIQVRLDEMNMRPLM